MPDYGQCDTCKKGALKLKEKKVVAGSEYSIVKCDKCNREVAKRAE